MVNILFLLFCCTEEKRKKNHKTPLYFSFSEKVNFLGISIVGQSNKRGDGGIYVGSIMKG